MGEVSGWHVSYLTFASELALFYIYLDMLVLDLRSITLTSTPVPKRRQGHF